MVFSKFIMILLGVYLAYYALNFLYDGFIKKEKKLTEDEEEVLSFVGEVEQEEVQPIKVDEYIPTPANEPVKKKVIEPEDENIQRIIEQEPVVMNVETQGIPFSMLIADSKMMFADIF